MQNQHLEDLLHEVNLITKKVQTEFGRLSIGQLNWKPAPDQWSIAQCLDHLIKANQQYFPLLEGIAKGTRKTSFWEKLPVLPGLFGKMMRKALDPSNQKKLKGPASFAPAASQLPASIVADFAQHQQQLSQLIRATDNVDHQKTIVSSPVSGLITFSLKDAISIIVVHEERHFMQAKRLLKATGFPETAGHAPNPTDPPRPHQPRPNQPRPNQPRPNQSKPNQPRPNQPRPNQPRTDKPRPDQPRTNQPRTDKPRPEQSRSNKPRPEQPRSNQPRQHKPGPDQPSPEQPKQHKSGPDQAGPNQPGSNKPRSNKPRPKQPRPDQPRPEQAGPEQASLPQQQPSRQSQ